MLQLSINKQLRIISILLALVFVPNAGYTLAPRATGNRITDPDDVISLIRARLAGKEVLILHENCKGLGKGKIIAFEDDDVVVIEFVSRDEQRKFKIEYLARHLVIMHPDGSQERLPDVPLPAARSMVLFPSASEGRAVVSQMLAEGLTYEEAVYWRLLKVDGHVRKLPDRFWYNRVTIANFAVATLDTIPGFKEARESGNIKTMAGLYRDHVINYKPLDKKRYKDGGQQIFFSERGGMAHVFMVSDRNILPETDKAAAVLKLAIPELVNLENPDALDPVEVEKGYWNNPENARYHILKALYKISGFEKAHKANDIKLMAELYRRYVIAYRPGRQIGFFKDNGLAPALLGHKKSYLAKANSPASLVRFAIPKLIDRANPDALNPLEVDDTYWQDPLNIQRAYLGALYTIDGFELAHVRGDIKTMAGLYREHVINHQPQNREKYKWGGQRTFLCEVGGLAGLVRGSRISFLDGQVATPVRLIRLFIPRLVDDSNPDALKSLEIEKGYWDDPDNVKSHFFQALYSIRGFKTAHRRNDIARMAELYRRHVMNYQVHDKKRSGSLGPGQVAFFTECGGLGGVMRRPRDFINGRSLTIRELLDFFIPGLVSETDPNGLKPEELNAEYWNKPANASRRILLALYTIDGFEIAHVRGDIKTMAGLYREHVIGYGETVSGKPGRKRGQIAFFIEIGGLRELLVRPRAYLERVNSPAALICFAISRLVDDNNPDALKSREVEHIPRKEPEAPREHDA